jgi:hypothetical protein
MTTNGRTPRGQVTGNFSSAPGSAPISGAHQPYGRVTSIEVPGAGTMALDQPRHPLAYELDG